MCTAVTARFLLLPVHLCLLHNTKMSFSNTKAASGVIFFFFEAVAPQFLYVAPPKELSLVLVIKHYKAGMNWKDFGGFYLLQTLCESVGREALLCQ